MTTLDPYIKVVIPKFLKQDQPEQQGRDQSDEGQEDLEDQQGEGQPDQQGEGQPGRQGEGQPGKDQPGQQPGKGQPGKGQPKAASNDPTTTTVIAPQGVDDHVIQDPTQAKQQPPGADDAVMRDQPDVSDHKPITDREVEEAIKEANKEVGEGEGEGEDIEMGDPLGDIPPETVGDRTNKEVVGPPGSGKRVSRLSRELFGKLRNTTTDWKDLLKRYIGHGKPTGSEETYKKLRKWSYGSYSPMPMHKPGKPALKILVAIDTSGSITKKIIYSFMCEVSKIVKTIPNATVHVVLWDDDVDAVYVDVKQKDIDKIGPPQYPGGTSVSCVKRWVDKHPKYTSNLSCVIYLTDMEFYDYPALFPKAPIIFCIPANLYRKHSADKYKSIGKIIKVGV